MIDPIGLTVASIQQDIQRMNVIAHNSANALTPGFKRELMTVSRGDAALMSDTFDSIPAAQRIVDHRLGVPRQTGGALDVALLGDGYFEVRTDTGLAYTRLGSFRLNERGYLVTQAGHPVVGMNGDILLSSPNVTIDRLGRVFEQGKQVAQIKVVAFDSPIALNPIGEGLMVPQAPGAMHELQQPAMAQAHLESSNVDSTQEMVRMMETFRHFETSHRVLQAYDDVHDKVLRNLGQF